MQDLNLATIDSGMELGYAEWFYHTYLGNVCDPTDYTKIKQESRIFSLISCLIV